MGPDANTTQSPQLEASDIASGVYRAICVDNRDPHQRGAIRVHCYPLHGDYKDMMVENMPWAEPIMPIREGFTPPEIFDLIWITFEHGYMYHLVYLGFRSADPVGRGTLPCDETFGSKRRIEGWPHKDLYPESLVIASSGEGNTVWMSDQELDSSNLYSSINLADTSGKQIKTWAVLLGQAAYATEESVSGSLDNQTIQPNTAARMGLEGPYTILPAFGAIDLVQQNIERSMQTSASEFSNDAVQQRDTKTTYGIEEHNVGGLIMRKHQKSVMHSMFDQNMFLTAKQIFAPNLLSLPDRYDLTSS